MGQTFKKTRQHLTKTSHNFKIMGQYFKKICICPLLASVRFTCFVWTPIFCEHSIVLRLHKS